MNKYLLLIGLFIASPAFASENVCQDNPDWQWCELVPDTAKVCEINFTNFYDSSYANFSCDGKEPVVNMQFNSRDSFETLVSGTLHIFLSKDYRIVNCSDFVFNDHRQKSCTLVRN